MEFNFNSHKNFTDSSNFESAKPFPKETAILPNSETPYSLNSVIGLRENNKKNIMFALQVNQLDFFKFVVFALPRVSYQTNQLKKVAYCLLEDTNALPL